MVIDSPNVTINSLASKIDVAPVIVNGRTLVPARFLAETFDAQVGWDGTNRIVTITTQPQ
jgi:hypothetical protein